MQLNRTVSPLRITLGEAALARVHVRNTSRWPSPSFAATDHAGEDQIRLEVARS